MNTNINTNDPFDRWLRQNADQGNPTPYPGDWDAPSPRVWNALREELNRRKRKRRLFWLFFTGIGMLFGAGWALYGIGLQKPANHALQINTIPEINFPPQHTAKLQNTATHQGVLPEELPTIAFLQPSKPNNAYPTDAIPLPTIQMQHLEGPLKSPTHLQVDFPRIALHCIHPNLSSVESNLASSEAPQIRLENPVSPTGQNQSTQKTLPDFPVKVDQPHRFYLSFAGGAGVSDRKIRNTDTGIVPNGKEKGAWVNQWGLGLGYRLNSHFALETGLQNSAILLKADRKGQFKYNSAGEVFDPLKNEFVNTVEKTLETAFGAVDVRFDLYRDASQSIPDQTKVKVAFHTEERVAFVRIPVGIRYYIGKGRLNGLISMGSGLNLRTSYRARIEFSQSDQLKINAVQAKVLRRATGMSEYWGDGFVGLGLNFKLSRRWELGWDAEYRRGFSTMYRNGPYASYPVFIGTQLGLRWNI